MASPVFALDALTLATRCPAPGFEAAMAQIPASAGARRLGMRLTVVSPGNAAWPYHCHHVNEEMFVILDGTGTLRLGAERHPLRAGDVVVCPPGGAETAHQIVNDGDRPLRYLAISTNDLPDVYEYPDTGKFGLKAGPPDERQFVHWGRKADAVDYWEGEGTVSGAGGERRRGAGAGAAAGGGDG